MSGAEATVRASRVSQGGDVARRNRLPGLDQSVLDFVVGRKVLAVDKRAASLANFRRVKAQGVTYPIIVTQKNSRVAGMLVSGITSEEARRLIEYEGANYQLVTLPITAGTRQRRLMFSSPWTKAV